MNFVADESVDRQIVERLRNDGHSVWYVAEMAPSISEYRGREHKRPSTQKPGSSDKNHTTIYQLKSI